MNDAMNTAVFARLGARPIPRVSRMMTVAEELGFEPVYCGALRHDGLTRTDTWGGWKVIRLGSPFPLLNGKRPFLYLKSIFLYNWHLFRYLRKSKPAILHASDFETMPASVLYRLFNRNLLIYNIHDNLAQRYNMPAGLACVLNVMEGICVRAADITVVPENFRRSALPRWCQRKVAVIRNTPEDTGYSPPEVADNSTIRIFFGGWLDWGRGLRALISMAEQNPDIDLRIAGEGAPEIVKELEGSPRVTYLGFLDHQAVMEETRRCHFISALYDPVRTINRYAASNKLAEALSIGRPIILNSEMHISKSLAPSACLVIVDYAHAHCIGPSLRALVRDQSAFIAASEEARRIYEKRFAWKPVRERIRTVLTGSKPDE